MTVQQGTAQTVVEIRTRRGVWMQQLVMGACWLAFGVAMMGVEREWTTRRMSFISVFWTGLGFVLVAQGLWLRTLGVDLTPGSAKVRGLRRREIPWPEVQAVLQRRRLGVWSVRLILENGEGVGLRAPTLAWEGFGAVAYERDFHQISQWWLAHRGESWRPVGPAAPRLPFQE
jgi:hypothetical protein